MTYKTEQEAFWAGEFGNATSIAIKAMRCWLLILIF